MAQAIDGFSDLAAELQRISQKATNKDIKLKALEAGAKPIVSRAKRIIAQHRRTGELGNGVISEFNERDNTIDIGWSKDAFYGRFLDNGFQHTGGKYVQVQHLKASYEAEKENALSNMVEVYRQELN